MKSPAGSLEVTPEHPITAEHYEDIKNHVSQEHRRAVTKANKGRATPRGRGQGPGEA